MASVKSEERLLDATFNDFATLLLSLYSGPQVTIRIGSESHEYKLPKALLCKQSSYFEAMFEGPFKEGKDFEVLVQWICLGRVVFRECAPDIDITTAIEFARLADMCCITGIESMMAEHIKAVILTNPAPEDRQYEGWRAPDTHAHCLTSEHIISAVALPEGHPVRAILAAATVEGYLGQRMYKFEKEASSVPEFAFDLLKALRTTTETIRGKPTTFEDPISQERFKLMRR
ncbi:hypothetical protein LHYA1_G005796 [Lachnellula hyalina]|uniref:BTB domain-containing protein n=1 Tax=Lachnellula hyalina TaxID=1316788 RepID=A0A8H8TXQ4_9HELO|nr:uncharacterized protein LHYA1_G005796 [Lachnellula hyalina]TVY26289.1 hypothetical protein LHYA1_G005796 [Lachnellula hyalina]